MDEDFERELCERFAEVPGLVDEIVGKDTPIIFAELAAWLEEGTTGLDSGY